MVELPGAGSRPPKLEGLEGLVAVGSGSFSTVYRARQPALDRVVAVKVLHVRLTDAESIRAFEDECTATGRLSEHPNIVTMHGSGVTEDGRPYILLTHYSGGSLAARAGRPLGLADALRIGIKISSALHAAHLAGVLHCDVKPGNVLMSRYGEPMLGDFGIATLRMDGSGASSLTPNFSAPEVLRGAPPSQASDTYSLAATVYALLTGRNPQERLPGEALEVMGERIRTGARPTLDHPEIDSVAAGVLLAGLHPDPVERVRSALEFGQSLQALQARSGASITELAGSPTTLARSMALPDAAPSAGSPGPISGPGPARGPAAPVAVPTGGQRAPMGLRAQAAVVDLSVSLSLTALGTIASQVAPEAPVPSLAGSVVAVVVGLFVYHVLFAGLVGPSLGRWWTKLTLSRGGVTGRIPMWLATVRGFVGLGSAVPLGAGYLAGLGKAQRTWSDEVTGVSVVLAGRPEPVVWVAATAAVAAAASVSVAIGAAYLLGSG